MTNLMEQLPANDAAGFLPIRPAEGPPPDPKRTREFVGDDGYLLRVPGLLRVESVSLDGFELPDTIGYTVPIDAELTRFVGLAYQTYRLTQDLDGTPALQRSQFSNNARWNKNARILVVGDFAEEAPALAPAPEEALPDAISRGEEPPTRGIGGRFGSRKAA